MFPSLCDWLDDEVPIEWLADFLKLIHDTPNLDWLLLTKRPQNFFTRMAAVVSHNNKKPMTGNLKADWDHVSPWTAGRNIPRNIWIGASAEDQTRLDERVPELLKIPAAVRFLSLEPLLGQIEICSCMCSAAATQLTLAHNEWCRRKGLHWVIVGGESGPGARPCNVEWLRDIVRQCKAAGVPCFVKQLGSHPIRGADDEPFERVIGKRAARTDNMHRVAPMHPKGGDPSEWPEDLRVREFPERVEATA